MQVTWKFYFKKIMTALIIFYVMTFGVGYYYMHSHSLTLTLIIFAVYVAIVFYGVVRLIRQLPMQVIMLLAPTVPLIALIFVVTLIPIFQKLH